MSRSRCRAGVTPEEARRRYELGLLLGRARKGSEDKP